MSAALAEAFDSFVDSVPEIASGRYRVGSRGNGFVWAIDDRIIRSDLDLSDHEDWIYKHISVPAGGTYIDIGGFVGTHAVRIAKSCSARVIVFEPVPEHRSLIEVNSKLNGVDLMIVPMAVGNRPKTVGFHVGGPSNSHLAEYSIKGDEIGYSIDVEMTTVDLAANCLERLDVIKIDVEGYECQVLDGAIKAVEKFKPKIIVEVHSHLPGFENNGNEIVRWCNANAYRYRTIWNNGSGYFYSELTPTDRNGSMVDTATVVRKLENMDRFLRSGPAGCVVEVGVYQGGSLRYLAERHPTRQFYGYDTFSGMPPVCGLDNHHKEGDFGNTSYEEVRTYLSDLPNVTLIKGFYPQSDTVRPPQIALAHVDVDIYQSTLDAFEHLAPRMTKNGRIYCDDAFVSTCHGATIAFCEFCGRHRRVPQFDAGTHASVSF